LGSKALVSKALGKKALTSMTMESSSAKSAAMSPPAAAAGRVTDTPAVGEGNAISSTAVTTPPSDTSWPVLKAWHQRVYIVGK